VIQTIINVVEDDSDIETIIIESTETNQNFQIVAVETIEEVKEEEEIAQIPFSLIEETPIYPGCEKFKDRASKKECMTKAGMQFV
jgi:protein TonB